MDRLRCLKIFSEVVRCGSFVRAATQLSLSKATVTKHVAWLESAMGAQLVHRSSKQVVLTEAGSRVLEGAREVLGRYDEMEAEVRDSVRLPRGAIRIGTPPSFGAFHLMPLVARFTERYPDIEVTMVLDDGRTNLLNEALDLSIRIAPSLRDASYVAQMLMKSPQLLVAAPGYLRTYGAPRSVADLARHNCLVHTIKSSSGTWRFAGPPAEEVRVRGTVRSNLGDALRQAAVLGAGISVHPTYMVAEDIRAGRLEVVLPQHEPEELEIYVVFSTRRNMPARVRHMLEFLKEWALKPPEWAAPRLPPTRPAARKRTARAAAPTPP